MNEEPKYQQLSSFHCQWKISVFLVWRRSAHPGNLPRDGKAKKSPAEQCGARGGTSSSARAKKIAQIVQEALENGATGPQNAVGAPKIAPENNQEASEDARAAEGQTSR
ncbi:hypothetical protein L5515_019243 [Caenorhabditis briggsae]|uniref:Uncharacterized protein n=1 Tax=Caenorhabditis briggsae TaxID=6238 RepID=A0AAE9FDT9_CAEBR|nr:hypothetical protein L5515_019243 [Caenorhabditis briggsae]